MITDNLFDIKGDRFTLGELEQRDIDNLIIIASEWVKDRDTGEVVKEELSSIRARMESIFESNEYRYYVIRDKDQEAIGCSAIREPELKMQQYKSTPNTKSCELVNVFLSSEHRGKGLGYRMMQFVFLKANELEFEEVIWNSGPRYKDSAWSFYTKLVGEPFELSKEFYGKGGDAPIWRKKL